jgi:hypothetical protein
LIRSCVRFGYGVATQFDRHVTALTRVARKSAATERRLPSSNAVAISICRFWLEYQAGRRPKLLLQSPPQHGKSSMVVNRRPARRARAARADRPQRSSAARIDRPVGPDPYFTAQGPRHCADNPGQALFDWWDQNGGEDFLRQDGRRSAQSGLSSIPCMSSSEKPKWWPISCTSTCAMIASSVSWCPLQ